MKKKGGHKFYQRFNNIVIKQENVDLNGIILI